MHQGPHDAPSPVDDQPERAADAGPVDGGAMGAPETDARLHAAQLAAGAGLWDWDVETGRITWSPAMYTLFGMVPGASPPRFARWREAMNPDDRELAEAAMWDAVRTGRRLHVQYRVPLPGGSQRWLEMSGRPVGDAAVPARRLAGLCLDITARKSDEHDRAVQREQLEGLVTERTAELLLAKDAAEAASRAKSAFLANMSHEIRTPLNAILGFTHLVWRDTRDSAQRDRLEKVETAGKHLLQILNDVLDLSKIEAGKVVAEDIEFNCGALVDNVLALVEQAARDKGLALRVEIDRLPQRLRGDPRLLSQALANLLSNSVKFTASGHVVLRGTLEPMAPVGERAGSLGGPSRALLRFEVQDTGVGVPPDRQGALFHAFEQGEVSTSRRFGGTGLGLALTRHLARLMNGEVGLRSVPGAGSSFWITAEVGVVDPVPAPATPSIDELGPEARARRVCAGRRVLLAEDNPVNRELAIALLERVGLIVEAVDDGDTALEQALSTHYDLVLMDVRMPRVDGITATRAMRARGLSVPVVALTANAFADDRSHCLAAGMNEHLAKPVEPERLWRMLERFLA